MTLPWGMVGGGPEAFIGAVHRMAGGLDGAYDLVAGAFSSDGARSTRMGAELGLDPARCYASYGAMADAEGAREDGIRIVSIVTPNHLHFPVAKAFLEAGVHVVCDKPLTTTVEDAEALCRLAAERDRIFAVTYNYTGYPMVKEARARVRRGDLGDVRKVVVEYSQGWLRTLLEAEGQKQAEWRGDPERAGASSALGDIGSHAFDLLCYVTGLEVRRIFADLGTVVPGRRMEDDATVLLDFEGGARGLLFVSQIASGERNGLRLRVYGSRAGLDWSQERPGRLRLLGEDGNETIVHRGAAPSAAAIAATRLPAGHPEGFIEAFANVYRIVAQAVRRREGESGGSTDEALGGDDGRFDYPTVQDGARGVHFIHTALASHRAGAWLDASYTPPGTDA